MNLPSAFARLALFAVVLLSVTGCGQVDRKSNKPALPPQLYTVTQSNESGVAIVTDTATGYFTTDGGCLVYTNPADRQDNYRRTLCGGFIRVKPQE